MMAISRKAMEGRDGFLFLNGLDANNLLDYLQGIRSIGAGAMHVHAMNRAVIARLDVPFVGIIVPEAHVIYPEKLPDGVTIADDRPVTQAIGHMAAGYVYAQDILRGFWQRGGVVYTGRDSHWTQTAALETYCALRSRLGREGPFIPAYRVSNNNETGDLADADLRTVIAAERTAQRVLGEVGYTLVYASGILNQGNVAVAHNPAREGRCLAFGTSFSTRLVPAYASDFRDVVFCYGTTIDPVMVELVKPDCVICELPERFLHFPSLSVPGAALISLSIGLREQAGQEAPRLAARKGLPEDLARIQALLASAAPDGRGLAGQPLMNALEAVAPDVAHKLALLATIGFAEPNDLQALRLVASGQFHNARILAKMARLVDDYRLGVGHLPLLPPSEGGHLTRIRTLIRARLFRAARREHEALVATFESRQETDYYGKLLDRMEAG